MLRLVTNVGEVALQFVHETGGVSLVLGRLCKRLFRFKIDGDEFFRSMRSYGEQSLLIIMLTAAFTGVIMVLQTAVYVKKFGVYDLVGWFAGFSTFREVAPLLIGLMFSGRVGANNCSELATMRITEQLDALRILALDVYELMILPRTLAMVLSMGVLTVFGNLMAVLSGALSARLLFDLEYNTFFFSLFDRLQPEDYLVGIEKALVYGFVIAIVSSHFGLNAKSGSRGVGRAVNAQVVACAVALFCVDYVMTSLIR